ncbi:MAG: YceI family protein [Pseudomonadota bacterium]
MGLRYLMLAGAAAALAACGQNAETASSSDANEASGVAVEAASAQQSADAFEFDAPSGVYESEATHRYITFSYSHLGFSDPWVRWREWNGTLNWNAEDPEQSSVSVVIDAASIDTGVDVFDGHMKGERLFDVANHPEITFESTNVEATGANTGTITGDLTIKGNTKPVTLDVVFNKGAFQERDNIYRLGFSGKTTVKRSDFGVDFAAPNVSDEVDIVIETEWIMSAPESSE